MQIIHKFLRQLQRPQRHQNSHQAKWILHFSQRHNRSGVTLIEMMMTMLVLSLALTALFFTLSQTVTFARDSEARIKAVALAREGIEALYSIRNTNWLRFSSNRAKCWNVKDYNASCISTSGSIATVSGNSLKLYQHTDKTWRVEPVTTSFDVNNFTQMADTFGIDVDAHGNFVARRGSTGLSNWCPNISSGATNCRSQFARILSITDPWTEGMMEVKSTVYWRGASSTKQVTLTATISNWKANYQ